MSKQAARKTAACLYFLEKYFYPINYSICKNNVNYENKEISNYV